MASLKRFGQRRPIVVNRRTKIIEAGNATHEAARRLGWQEIATLWVKDDDSTATGYAIADNRTAEMASWTDELLAEAVAGLRVAGENEIFESLALEDVVSPTPAPVDQAEPAKPELPITPELYERQDCIVVIVENSLDWIVLCDQLDIETVRAEPNESSTIEHQGIGRVITAARLLEALGVQGGAPA